MPPDRNVGEKDTKRGRLTPSPFGFSRVNFSTPLYFVSVIPFYIVLLKGILGHEPQATLLIRRVETYNLTISLQFRLDQIQNVFLDLQPVDTVQTVLKLSVRLVKHL